MPLQMTDDHGARLMTLACVFSLNLTPALRGAVANSGVVELALDALVRHDFDTELEDGDTQSEIMLANLAVVSQLADHPKFRQRLENVDTICLLQRLACGREDQVVGQRGDDNSGSRSSNEDADSAQSGAYTARIGDAQHKQLPCRRGSGIKMASVYVVALRCCVMGIVESLSSPLPGVPSSTTQTKAMTVRSDLSGVFDRGEFEAPTEHRCWRLDPNFTYSV